MIGFGVELEPLSVETIELVRKWRNSAHVQQMMEFQDEIDSDAQRKWFQSLKNAHYFIIKVEGKPLGLIDLKKIDVDTKTAESGLLIGEKEFLGSGIALGASLLLLHFAFYELKLESVVAKIAVKNQEAIAYNSFLGFTLKEKLTADFQLWELTKATFELKEKQLRQIIEK